MVAFASSLDQAGCLARNVFDASLGLETIMGHDPMDSTCQKVEVPKLSQAILNSTSQDLAKTFGIIKNAGDLGLNPEILNAYQKLVDELKKKGAKIVELDLPLNDQSIAVYYL